MIRNQHIVFLTGAGMSVESGLSTFRGKDGLWNNKDWQYYASTEGLDQEPAEFLRFYNWRRQKLAEVAPNNAHRMMAELEKTNRVTIITQNVDDLHERAGSTHVLHLHGELRKVCSSFNRLDARYIRDYPLTTPIRVGDDAGDGSQMRPFVVLFGEFVSGMDQAMALVGEADVFVVVGTSLMVYPANGLINYARVDVPRFVIDPANMPQCEELGFEHIQATAVGGMAVFLERLTTL
ncbi:MAG: NAD-dependent deacylase [Muribaculaceae bacterium]|nr:NAD-dependent deacylase [Muribaculaceae bacterium]